MKKLLVILCVCCLSVAAFAQKANQSEKIDKRVAKMTEQLELTADQQTKVKALYTERMAAKEANKDLEKADRKATKLAFNEQLTAILTPEQLEKHQSMERAKNSGKGKMKGKDKMAKKGRKGQGKPHRALMTPEQMESRSVKATERLSRQVSLTEAQTPKVQEAYLNMYLKTADISQNEQLDAEEKKGLFKELKAQHKADLEAILTPEQLAARKENKMKHKNKGAKKAKHKQESEEH